MRLKLKRLWTWFWLSSEPMVALIAAAAVTGLAAADELGQNARSTATLGVLAVVAFALLGGPFFVLLLLFHWSDALAFLVGIPLGLALTIGAYAALEWVTNRKRGQGA